MDIARIFISVALVAYLITHDCEAQSKTSTAGNKKNTEHMASKQKGTSQGFQTGYASVNGLELYYEIHGKGKPLVLMHGGGSTIGTTFGRVLPFFAQHHQVIAVELQAHGHTKDIDRPLSFEQDADDVATLLTQLHISSADFFGFSNGASTALEIAIRHPGVVDKLVVASTMYKKAGADPGFWQVINDATFETMPLELKDAYLSINPSQDDLLKMYNRDITRMRTFKDIPETDIRGIRARTLIISGDQDVLRPEHAVEMYRQIPHAKLMILPGGHGGYIGEITTLKNNNKEYLHTQTLIESFFSAAGDK
jgi:pimeloyl-ACP methyl ester carboxylesterase